MNVYAMAPAKDASTWLPFTHLSAVVGIREDPGQTLIHGVQDLGWSHNQPCLTAVQVYSFRLYNSLQKNLEFTLRLLNSY